MPVPAWFFPVFQSALERRKHVNWLAAIARTRLRPRAVFGPSYGALLCMTVLFRNPPPVAREGASHLHDQVTSFGNRSELYPSVQFDVPVRCHRVASVKIGSNHWTEFSANRTSGRGSDCDFPTSSLNAASLGYWRSSPCANFAHAALMVDALTASGPFGSILM